jgi:hypothetical protein
MGNIYIAGYTLAAIVIAGLMLLPVAWWQWTKRKTGSRRTWEATGLAAISLGVALYFGILILAGMCHWTPNEAAPYERIVAILGTPLTVYSVVIAFARSGRPRWAFVASSLSIGLLYTLAVLGALSP